MEAYRKSGNIIAIKRHPNNADAVEQMILEMRKLLTEFRTCCENRTMEVFPHETVERLVECCEALKEEVMDIPVDEEYLNTVGRTRDVGGYFEENFRELAEAERTWRTKRECFNTFYENLLDLKETHFAD